MIPTVVNQSRYVFRWQRQNTKCLLGLSLLTSQWTSTGKFLQHFLSNLITFCFSLCSKVVLHSCFYNFHWEIVDERCLNVLKYTEFIKIYITPVLIVQKRPDCIDVFCWSPYSQFFKSFNQMSFFNLSFTFKIKGAECWGSISMTLHNFSPYEFG